MANPTSQVPSTAQEYEDTKGIWPIIASTATTYQTGEMVGVDPATGYADHFDDTKAMKFLGLFDGLHQVQDSTSPLPAYIRYNRPYRFSMPLASGTATRAGDITSNIYAKDSGHVAKSGTSNSNLAGTIVDIVGVTPEDIVTPTGGQVWIKPP